MSKDHLSPGNQWLESLPRETRVEFEKMRELIADRVTAAGMIQILLDEGMTKGRLTIEEYKEEVAKYDAQITVYKKEHSEFMHYFHLIEEEVDRLIKEIRKNQDLGNWMD